MSSLLAMAAVLLYAGCVDTDRETGPSSEDGRWPTFLAIYVYSPEKPVVTRGSDDVSASFAERRVRSLQIWVFQHDSGELVGYLSPMTNVLNSEQSDAFLMDVTESFSKNLPHVDVFVAANVGNSSLGSSSTRAELESALMVNGDNADFGITSLTMSVPTAGLPMTGVLRNQPVYGDTPVLRIGTSSEIATVKLLRTVSKMRFFFTCHAEATESVVIDDIVLGGNMIPTDEYLFLSDDGSSCHIGGDYESASTLLATAVGEPATCTAPSAYVYNLGMEAQEYENLLESGRTSGQLTQVGPYYLRESDRLLSGTISYHVNGKARQASFQMEQAYGFSRNHTWVVLGYFESNTDGDLQLNSIFVKDWSEVSREHNLYDW